ncbi:MAG: hypothetical protein ACKVS9_14070 [Phycisphaerae bacterium]
MCLLAAPVAAQDKAADAKAGETKSGESTGEPSGPLCPVMEGEPIDPKTWVRYRGKRVYVCCEECVQQFKEDPEKYAAGIKVQWDAMRPLRVQIKCPVTGETPQSKFLVELPDRDVFFANADAQEKFRKDRKPFLKKLDEECYTFQGMCPCGGKEIDPTISHKFGERTVYFCCEGCVEPFKKDGEPAIKKLDEHIKSNEAKFKKAEKPRAP